jgi:hypothetical protein
MEHEDAEWQVPVWSYARPPLGAYTTIRILIVPLFQLLVDALAQTVWLEGQ